MPELPEVETTRRGIAPHIVGRRVTAVHVRHRGMRWPVPRTLDRELPGRVIESVERRAKYLLLRAGDRHLLLHLGMSGSLCVVPQALPPRVHDHLDIAFDSGRMLRLRDPRRFGAALWLKGDPLRHALLKNLGPEPLGDDFSAALLYRTTRGRSVAIKNLLMNSHVVVGVGNIYVNEALFLAGVRPARQSHRVTRAECERLHAAVRRVLEEAILQGGTTLRDFANAAGEPGYFQLKLRVYGRSGESCFTCGTAIRGVTIGQRSSFYCPNCQR